jgi:hypothetical protein
MENEVKEKTKDFSDLLDSIESLGDKKKKLWKEIYENALTDRQNSYAIFLKMCSIVKDQSSEYAIHGKVMATFVERMSKANDQLIRLAELIAKAENASESIDPEDMFNRINS